MKKTSIFLGIKVFAVCVLLSTLTISDGIGKTADLPNGIAYVNSKGWLNLRKGPSKSTARLQKLYLNDTVNIIGRQGEWYKIDSPQNGWVMADFISGEPVGEENNNDEDDSNLSPQEEEKVGRDIFNSAKHAELTTVP